MRGRRRLAIGGLCILFAGACSSTAVSQGAGTSTPSDGAERATVTTTTTATIIPTEYAVGTREETYVDTTRRDPGERLVRRRTRADRADALLLPG